MRWYVLPLLLLLLVGCSHQPKPGLYPAGTDAVLPDLVDDGGYAGLAEAIRRSLEYYGRLPDDRSFTYGEWTYTAREMEASMRHFLFLQQTLSEDELEQRLRADFHIFESRNEEGRAFFTGYYEPVLSGRLQPGEEAFASPLYAMPEDLIEADLGAFSDELEGRTLRGKLSGKRLIPYDDRSEIVYQNSLDQRAQPLAYLENDIEVFFLQIQGSGLVQLDNGTLLRLNYAGQNGHSYFAIGRLLLDKIPREQMSLQSIKQYLYEHPDEVESILATNPSYTFFRLVEEGPLGNIEVPLTPERSIAMDRRVIPKGGLVWLETTYPAAAFPEENKPRPLRRFGVVQDTGGAIRGHGRADIFWGNGERAERIAGPMKQAGRLFLLVARKEVLESAPPGDDSLEGVSLR